MEDSMAKVSFFMGFERRFQFLAKLCVILAGGSGIGLFWERGAFSSLTGEEAILLAYKFFVWLVFAVLLFGAEQRLMGTLVSKDTPPEVAMRRLAIFHWVVLILSLIAIVAGIKLARG
jgi:cytochrome b subunit of formate dehydrogenase